ncbi:precorrin-2 C(20)-methyltransferase [Alkaliphilus hydrothermalis]|uniref:Precorrin-2/cobalt-factor-2 C20-methyltransferase n=1 Tax=Alkaliphilus hydrothermalis TaxID=1482730 RepID=A0ABS2NP65_9FIRM|nr:precorrin-2 C(20)-methyltransferase [Alkaliphilus hydrothermalis]MBM7614726.1 precorrin-2/cobalt-factor-2 C20-methyltransferase [Alkaliphilus hydrothermalis]
MKGKLTGVGVGPGDPELLTIKAVKKIQEAQAIIAPCSKAEEDSVALAIVEEYLQEDTIVYKMVFPMVHCKDTLEKAWQQNVQEVMELLDRGQEVVFLTLGDPMLYSTYIYILRRILEEGYSVESVAGITSFCAVANQMNFPLAEGQEGLTIIPFKKNEALLENALQQGNNVVVLKPSHNPKALAELMEKYQLENSFVMVSKSGQPQESTTTDINLLKEGKIPYLSTVIIKNRRGGNDNG